MPLVWYKFIISFFFGSWRILWKVVGGLFELIMITGKDITCFEA